MSSPKILTPEYIQQIIAAEEIPLRAKEFPADMVKAILRYGAVIGATVEHYPCLPRGMDRARRVIRDAEEKKLSFHTGLVILADEMAQSKGRFKRSWHAPRGGLWMTIAMVNTLLPENCRLFSMAAGVSCCEVLRHYGIAAKIKWVNDIMVDNRKVAGILTETFTGGSPAEEYVLVGIGINVNNSQFPSGLFAKAVSVKSCLGREVDIVELAARLLAKLRWNFGLLQYEEARDLEDNGGIAKRHESGTMTMPAREHLLLQSYKSLTDIFNRRVLFGFDVQKQPQFVAKVVGLDYSGGLILEMEDGARTIQHSGEIIYLD